MGPIEYKKKTYQSISVLSPGGLQLTLSSIRYLNIGYKDLAGDDPVSKYLRTQANNGQKGLDNLGAALAEASGVPAHAQKHAPKYLFVLCGPKFGARLIDRMALMRAHYGKGSPQDVRDVLFALAFCLGDGRDRLSNAAERRIDSYLRNLGLKAFTGAEKVQAQLNDLLHKYCDAHIGLDCSGFAVNYFGIDEDHKAGWFASQDRRRRDVSKVAPCDSTVWFKNDAGTGEGSHIAVLDSLQKVGPDTYEIQYAEADDGWLKQGAERVRFWVEGQFVRASWKRAGHSAFIAEPPKFPPAPRC
jgi:hypothetical protein